MIYTVFSTTDSPYMQWQSELLEYSWKEVGQPGELIRLVSTDQPTSLPVHRHARCVPTRQWKIHPHTGDDFAPYNKPSSLFEWLSREHPEGTILLLDPDCVFRERVEREVEPGRPVGQHWIDLTPDGPGPFGLGDRFEKTRRHCSDPDRSVDPVMIPNLIHSEDLRRLSLRWLELTGVVRQEVRNHQDNPMWESDMFGFIMASAELGLRHELGTLGICTNWSPERVKNAPIIHYCQRIRDRDDNAIWSKGTYRPWEPPPDPETAAEDYGRDLLRLIERFIRHREEGATRSPRRSPDVSFRRRPDGAAEVTAPGYDAHALNTTAEAVWDLCDGERTVDEIAEVLAPRYGVAAADIVADIEAGVGAMRAAGVVEP